MNYTCKKGWILSLDEQGNYVPFFIKTRSKDITWTIDSSFYKKVKKLITNNEMHYTFKMNIPEAELKMDIDDWDYRILSDYSFKANKTMIINYKKFKQGYSKFIDPDTNEEIEIISSLKVDLQLPFLIEKTKSSILYNFFSDNCDPMIKSDLRFSNKNNSDNNKVYDTLTLTLHDLNLVSLDSTSNASMSVNIEKFRSYNGELNKIFSGESKCNLMLQMCGIIYK